MKTECLTVNCHHTARARGICNTCYANAIRLINLKRTTWRELEKLKLVNPSYQNTKSNFISAFNKAKSKFHE